MLAPLAALAALAAASPSAVLFEQGAPAFRSFGTADGLPDSTAQALAMDARGQLWVGTQDGVAAALGASFRPLSAPWAKVSRFVNAVLAASDGSLWIATTGSGVLRHGPDGWTQFDEAAGLPSPHAYALAEVRGRGIFAGTARGLARLEGARFAADPGAGLGTPGVKVLLAEGSTLWIGTESGLWRDQAEGRKRVDGLPDSPVRALLAAGPEELWVGTEAGLLVLRAGRVSTAENEGLPRAPVTALARTPGEGGAIWAGTAGGGLARRRSGRWRTFAKGTGLPDNDVLSLLADERSGRSQLWIGTRGGLASLVEGGFRSFPQGPAFLRDKVSALLEIASGGAAGFWIAA